MKNKWLTFFTLICISCHSGKQQNEGGASDSASKTDSSVKKNVEAPTEQPVAHSFWDSISMQLKLSPDQIAKYTIVDSFYYVKDTSYEKEYADANGFWGDTIYTTQNLKIAILDYSTPTCGEKFLLVFDSAGTHNLNYRIIAEACDGDGDMPYSSTQHKILTDSTFETTENFAPKGNETEEKDITTHVIRWKINSRGVVDSIPLPKTKRKSKS